MLYLQFAINDLISVGPRSLSVSVSQTGQGNLHVNEFAESIYIYVCALLGCIYDETKHFSNTDADFEVVLWARVFCCCSNLRRGLSCWSVMSSLTLTQRIAQINNH